eukprot:scaffold86529_cov42-Prasinocladus_malaysianus.AAC.1
MEINHQTQTVNDDQSKHSADSSAGFASRIRVSAAGFDIEMPSRAFCLAVVLGMLSISCNPAAAYGGLLYFPTFLTATTGMYSLRQATSLAITGTVTGIVMSPVCGFLGDRYGHSRMIFLGTLLAMLLSWPLWALTVVSLPWAYVAVALWACMLAFQ